MIALLLRQHTTRRLTCQESSRFRSRADQESGYRVKTLLIHLDNGIPGKTQYRLSCMSKEESKGQYSSIYPISSILKPRSSATGQSPNVIGASNTGSNVLVIQTNSAFANTSRLQKTQN